MKLFGNILFCLKFQNSSKLVYAIVVVQKNGFHVTFVFRCDEYLKALRNIALHQPRLRFSERFASESSQSCLEVLPVGKTPIFWFFDFFSMINKKADLKDGAQLTHLWEKISLLIIFHYYFAVIIEKLCGRNGAQFIKYVYNNRT